ncbi:MAG: hypothetical protein Q8K63_00870 [Acidimicrobiales bacterium]|nr:hypothetical protein [Acidimicrobiales bacterium]
MAKVSVEPAEFHFVLFDASEIASLVGEVADLVGLDREVQVTIDESTPLGRSSVTSLDPIVLSVEGGAFENAKAPRHLSARSVRDVTARLLFRVSDRLSGRFDDAPIDGEVPLPLNVAWDVYAVGRAARAGVDVSKARRLYHFRNRHGFTDVADAAFETLWAGDNLSWAEIEALVADVTAAKTPA